MATSDYEKAKAELREYFCNVKRPESWLKIASSSGSIYGKIERIGENFVYLNPSLVWEEHLSGKKESGFRLEDKIASIMHLGHVFGIQSVTQDNIDSLLGVESKKKPGFSQDGGE